MTARVARRTREWFESNWAAAYRARAMNWVVADQLLVSGTSFFTGVLLARTLGVEAFGVFSLAWLTLLFAQSLQQAIVFSPMMSIGPKQTTGDASLYYAAVGIQQLALSVVCAVCVILVWPLERSLALRWMDTDVIIALAVCVFVVQLYEFLRRYNFTIQRPRTVFLTDLARNGLQLVVLYVLVPQNPNIGVPSVLLMIAACTLIGILAFFQSAAALRWEPSRIGLVARRHAHFSKWLVGSALLQWTAGNFIIVASGVILGPVAVGALKASQTLIGVTHVFFQAAENVLPSYAARIYDRGGQQALRAFVRRLMLVGAGGTALAGLTLAIPARQWLALIFGESYAGYSLLVAGYAVAYFLLACTIPLRFAFLAVERTRPIFIGYVLATVFTLIACYPLIKVLGLDGAITGIVITDAILLATFTVYYRRDLAGSGRMDDNG